MQFPLRTTIGPYCYLLFTISLCDVLLYAVNAKDAVHDIDNFKNKDIVLKNVLPDLSALNYASIRDSTSGYFEKLLAAWNTLKYPQSMILKGVLHFISKWKKNRGYRFSVFADVPFTVVVPNVDIATIDREKLPEFIQEHLIIGEAFSTFNEDDVYGNCNKRAVRFTHMGDKFKESIWTLNDHNITRTAVLNKQCSVIYIDGVLGDKKTLFSKRNIHDNNNRCAHVLEKKTQPIVWIEILSVAAIYGRYNAPQRLEWKNATKEEMGQDKQSAKMNALSTFLMGMRTGTKVFQHFLSKSNLSHLIDGN